MTTMITARVDSQKRKTAEKVFFEVGLTVSAVVNLFICVVAMRGEISFQLRANFGLPGEYLLCDRRFRAEERLAWAEACGLAVTERRFVRAVFNADFDVSTGKKFF